jgi:ADP-ribose pyrophosphatase YjhB (NUDIX family)
MSKQQRKRKAKRDTSYKATNKEGALKANDKEYLVPTEIKKEHNLWQRYQYVYAYTQTKEQFMKHEGWEKEVDESDMQEMKRMFLDQTEGDEHERFYWARWKAGLIDSAGDYITIGHYFVLNLCAAETEMLAPFVTHFCTQREDTFESPLLHPPDVTYDHLDNWTWGEGGALWAWREKKDGTHGYASNGHFYSNWWKGDAPKNVQSCEFTPDGVYVLYPYLTKSIMHQGVELKPHPWRSPDEYTVQSEGIVILTAHGEIRCKNIPTTEVEENGTIWEVGNDGPVMRFIRPRLKLPGKAVTLHSRVSLRYLDIPKLTYKIEYRTSGPVESTKFEAGTLRVESGYRTGPIDRVAVGDVIHYTSGKHTIVRHRNLPPPDLYLFSVAQTPRFGVKAFWKEFGVPILFKDGTKNWDLIGGKVETTDTSTLSALKREILEETGVRYTGKATYIGLVEGAEWSTALYQIDPVHPVKGRFSRWEEGMTVTPWLPPLLYHVSRYVSEPIHTYSFQKMSLSEHGAMLSKAVQQQELNGSARLRITRSMRVSPVMSAHAMYAFKNYFKIRPQHRTTFLLQLRNQYRVDNIEPPDPYQLNLVLTLLSALSSAPFAAMNGCRCGDPISS